MVVEILWYLITGSIVLFCIGLTVLFILASAVAWVALFLPSSYQESKNERLFMWGLRITSFLVIALFLGASLSEH